MRIYQKPNWQIWLGGISLTISLVTGTAGILYLAEDLEAKGLSLCYVACASGTIGALSIAWGVMRKNRALEAFARSKRRNMKVRRRAANHHEILAELHGDFVRHFNYPDPKRGQELRDRLVEKFHAAHDDLEEVDQYAADYFVDGTNIDAIQFDQKNVMRLILHKLERLQDLKRNEMSLE